MVYRRHRFTIGRLRETGINTEFGAAATHIPTILYKERERERGVERGRRAGGGGEGLAEALYCLTDSKLNLQ